MQLKGNNVAAATAGTVPETRRSGRGRRLHMAPKLAYRNLFHDKLSLVVTLTGIVFSVVLIAGYTSI